MITDNLMQDWQSYKDQPVITDNLMQHCQEPPSQKKKNHWHYQVQVLSFGRGEKPKYGFRILYGGS